MSCTSCQVDDLVALSWGDLADLDENAETINISAEQLAQKRQDREDTYCGFICRICFK